MVADAREAADAAKDRDASGAPLPHPRHILLGDPADFSVEEAHNAFMQTEDGGLQRVDRAAARREWEALRRTYQQLGMEVHVLPARGGLADLCFTANPSLALPTADGGTEVWLARMCHASRQPEVQAHADFYAGLGIPLRELPPGIAPFEGAGDGLLHPGRMRLHCGIGPRSCRAAWEALAEARPDLELLHYPLQDPRYYHLDTALVPLDAERALYVESAFDREGCAQLRRAFPGAAPIHPEEALRFAGNAHCPDGHHVLLQEGCPRTEAWLRAEGFEPLALQTAEFRKSGGSVFCLKQAF